MPAFVTNGPDIPERLLQVHEEGRVVFFCGAGISYPARLPSFSGLVTSVYKELGVAPNAVQQAAIKAYQFDTAIGLLEADIVGGREIARRALARILTPDLTGRSATATHEALLILGRNRSGRLRLVTTNFDRLFEEVITSKSLVVERFKAPFLPVPKNRWDGLVYLHGLLPAPSTLTASDLDRLIVSSGDFGLAYLTERWAARFVSELFRNYTVCFVGYSINDPVLRYMMDALAADRLLGESPPEMFAFGSYSRGKETQRAAEWRAKNVTPILYREERSHTYLHKTLREWAATYRDGVRGKEMIITQHASTPPLTPSRLDFAVGRVLWALTDGLAAKHFADLTSVPPLEWLGPLAEAQFGHDDLSRFGVVPKSEKDDKLTFSVIRRPAPYTRASWMRIADMGSRGSEWDDVMFHLARWLTRHLDDPKLILWLAKQGGQLHTGFARLVRGRIEELDRLDREGKQDELDRIRAAAPKAIPSPLMRTLWRLILSERLRARTHDFDLYDWLRRYKQDGLTPTLRIELREILTPCVTVREPFRWEEEPSDSSEPKRIKDLVDWELVLSSDHVHAALHDRTNKPDWQAVLPDLLDDFTVLLRDALDLMQELGGVENKADLSYLHQPSISEHAQNRDFRDWTALIELTRDAWLATAQIDPLRARHAAEGWWRIPYPLFKRLAFFAAAQGDVITQRQALDWLLADGHWWLWSVETQREALRLLVALSPKLGAPEMAELEQAILQGPPREMFKEELDPQEWARIVDRDVWLRLAKAQAAGVVLGQDAKGKLEELAQQYPRWQLAEDERDEFPFWMGEGDEWRKFVPAPRRRRELVEWLKQPASPDHWQEDDWRQRCRDNFSTTACALCALVQQNQWPVERWREALQAWGEDNLLKRSWRYMTQLIVQAPNDVVKALSHSLGWWLQAQAKSFTGQEERFFALIRRLLELEHQDGEGADDDPVFRALNQPVGHVTQALLHWWYRQGPKDAEGLRDEVKPLFTELCDARVERFRHGRVLVAAHAIALFRVDEEWARTYLLPLFDWQRSKVEARAAWEGFLWSPRLYQPLLSALKQPLLRTATHYEQLGKHAEQYAAFLTFAALDPGDTFTIKELADATRTLPAEGLQSAAQALVRALEGAKEQRGEYWRNRLLPYLRNVWPKSRDLVTPAISESLGRLCIAAREAFPEALKELRHWLQPVQHSDFLAHLMHEAKLCEQFPADSLAFLDAVVGDDAQWPPRELKMCLDEIGNADPQLVQDARFTRLTELYRRRGVA